MKVRSIIRLFGGIRPMARALGHATHSTVQGWWLRDTIPAKRQAEVLRAARRAGLQLSANDLIDWMEAA
ncbi:carph-isopro domain-containing protein [Sphingomonas pseudosanguinis]|uniref:carph-isopro domain-containing protein n=1 Tax=Sphingomonas pseudosanguinis TaxID=413712 RepID=UPI003F8603F1